MTCMTIQVMTLQPKDKVQTSQKCKLDLVFKDSEVGESTRIEVFQVKTIIFTCNGKISFEEFCEKNTL